MYVSYTHTSTYILSFASAPQLFRPCCPCHSCRRSFLLPRPRQSNLGLCVSVSSNSSFHFPREATRLGVAAVVTAAAAPVLPPSLAGLPSSEVAVSTAVYVGSSSASGSSARCMGQSVCTIVRTCCIHAKSVT